MSISVSATTSLFRRYTQSLFVRQVGTTFLSQGLTLLLSMAIAGLTARWLGPTGRGQLALALLIPGMLQLFLGFGINTANVYFSGSRRLTISELSAHSTSFALIGTLVGCLIVLFLVFGHRLSVIVPGVPTTFMLLGMIALPIGLFSSNLSSILQGLRHITALNVFNVAQKALILPLLFLFVIWMKQGISGAIVATLAASFIVLGGTIWYLKREAAAFWPRWTPHIVKSTLQYGLKGYIGNILQFFNYRLDTFIVNAFIGPAGVGIYNASVTLAELLWQLPNSVGFVIFPKASGTDHNTMNRFTPKVFWIVLVVSLMGAAVLALFGRFAIRIIFSDAFSAAYMPLLVLLPGVVFLGAGKVLTNDIAGRGYPHYNSIISGSALVLTIGLDFLLIPRIGVTGAALASTVAYSVTFIMSAIFYLSVSRRGTYRVNVTPPT